MAATNWGDAAVLAVRNVLATVTGVPVILYQNTNSEPESVDGFISDRILTRDSVYRECGPTAWRRTTLTYQVVIRQPINVDVLAGEALGVAVEDKFAAVCGAGTLKVQNLYPVDLLASRSGPSQEEPNWLATPVTLSLTFDHP